MALFAGSPWQLGQQRRPWQHWSEALGTGPAQAQPWMGGFMAEMTRQPSVSVVMEMYLLRAMHSVLHNQWSMAMASVPGLGAGQGEQR